MTGPISGSTPAPKREGSPGFGSGKGVPPLAPTIRTEPQPDAQQRTIMGILVGAVVLLSIMVAVLGVTLRHVNMTATAQPCSEADTAVIPTAPAGAGEAHLPSASSISPSPVATPETPAPSTSTQTVPASTGTSTTAPANPNDVGAYLKYIQTTDQKRVALLANPNSADPSTEQNGQTPAPDWNSVISEFQNHPVPDVCSQFGNEYGRFLTECQALSTKPDTLPQVTDEAARLDKELDALYQSTVHLIKPFTITMPTTPETTSATDIGRGRLPGAP